MTTATATGSSSLLPCDFAAGGPRRHLTPDQLAAIAVAMLPELEKAAKERQKAAIKERDEKGRAKPLPQKSGEVDKHSGESTAQAAAVVGVKRSRVLAAKAIAEKAPEAIIAVSGGVGLARHFRRWGPPRRFRRGRPGRNKPQRAQRTQRRLSPQFPPRPLRPLR